MTAQWTQFASSALSRNCMVLALSGSRRNPQYENTQMLQSNNGVSDPKAARRTLELPVALYSLVLRTGSLLFRSVRSGVRSTSTSAHKYFVTWSNSINVHTWVGPKTLEMGGTVGSPHRMAVWRRKTKHATTTVPYSSCISVLPDSSDFPGWRPKRLL